MALFSACVLLAQGSLGQAPAPPTLGILRDVRTWTFLSQTAKDLIPKAEQAVQKRNWTRALDANEALLEVAPSSIFSSSPSLPIVKIWSTGERPPDTPQTVVDGWQWRLETAWLAAYAKDFDGALRRFTVIAQNSLGKRGLALEGAAFSLARARRYNEVIETERAAGTLSPARAKVWQLAARARTEDYLELHRIATNAPRPADPLRSPSAVPPSLSGPIGRLNQVLPAPGRGGSASAAKPAAGAPSGSEGVEAALILTEVWAASRGDIAQKRLQVQLYANLVIQRAGSIFPHHRQIAVDLAAAASQR